MAVLAPELTRKDAFQQPCSSYSTNDPETYILPKVMVFPASLSPASTQSCSELQHLDPYVLRSDGSQDSLAGSWVYFIQGTFCTCGVSLYM